MDPNAALEAIRKLCKTLKVYENLSRSQVDELVDVVSALDGWLTRGGFLPEAWAGRSLVPTRRDPFVP